MPAITILSGEFPHQTAFIVADHMAVKLISNEKRIYIMSRAVVAVRKVSEHRKEVLCEIDLRDGKTIRVETNPGTFHKLNKYANPQGYGLPFVVEPKQTKPKAEQASTGKSIATAAILGFLLVCMYACTVPSSLPPPPSPQSSVASAPGAGEIQRDTAGESQAKANLEAQAARIISEVKAYEDFLDNDEATFKAIKPSDADLETIRKATSTFSALAESLNKARQNKDALSASDIAYLRGVENRLSAFQQKILPGLRLGFKKRASELLWQYNTEVSTSGAGNKTIGFYAGEFSLNANIQAVQEQLTEILTKLRFKEVRYAWHKGAAGYAYKLDTPPDAKLSYFLHGRFQDMAAKF